MKKKWASGVLCTVMLAGGLTPVEASTTSNVKEAVESVALQNAIKEAKISKEKAVEIAKKAVKISDEFKQEDVRFSSNYRNTEMWSVEWNKRSEGYHHIRVGVDANSGEIVSINRYMHEEDVERTFPPKVDYDKAIDIAEQYIKEHFPEKSGNLILDERAKKRSQDQPFRKTYHHRVSFHYQVNGVSFNRNQLSFTINGNGDITNFSYSWQPEVTFEKPNNVLEQDQAEQLLEEHMEAQLKYRLDPYAERHGRKVEPHLTYIASSVNQSDEYNQLGMLDAQTGEWINRKGEPLAEEENEYKVSEEPVAEKATPLKERKEELTQKEAFDILKSMIDIPEGYELDHANYNDRSHYSEENASWRFYFREKDNRSHYKRLSATIDAKTGELLNYRNEDRHRYYDKEEPEEIEVNVTKEEAKEIALNFINKAAGSKLDKLYITTPRDIKHHPDEEPSAYRVNFVRKENGIEVLNQNINLTISSETGEILYYYLRWTDVDFPEVEDLLTKEKAKELLLSSYDMKIDYYVPYADKDEKENKEANLVYMPNFKVYNYNVYLDAKTGKWINEETGKEYTEEKPKAIDIKGHTAEDALQSMLDYKFFDLDDEGKLNPDTELTRVELLEVFLKSLGYDRYYYNRRDEDFPYTDVKKTDDAYRYIYTAIQRNVLDPNGEKKFYPDKSADREFFTTLIVEALHYDELASMDGIFKADFKDNDAIEMKGHAALADRLGILEDEDGYFYPEKGITKADFAVSIMKFLELQPKLN